MSEITWSDIDEANDEPEGGYWPNYSHVRITAPALGDWTDWVGRTGYILYKRFGHSYWVSIDDGGPDSGLGTTFDGTDLERIPPTQPYHYGYEPAQEKEATR